MIGTVILVSVFVLTFVYLVYLLNDDIEQDRLYKAMLDDLTLSVTETEPEEHDPMDIRCSSCGLWWPEKEYRVARRHMVNPEDAICRWCLEERGGE